MPRISLSKRRASSSLSLMPFSITYSNVMRFAFLALGYSLQDLINSFKGNFLLIGTISLRNSSFVACNDIASPFHFRDIDDELWGFGEKSSVLVYGRLKMKVQDGQSMPQLAVFGVYTNPSRAIRRVGGGDTDSSQFE